MIKRVIAGAGLAMVLVARDSSAAVAPGPSPSTYCYTGVAGFSACASATIVVNSGLTQLQIAIQNLSGVQGNTSFSITQFGLYYLVPPNYTGTLTKLTPFSGWQNGITNSLTRPGPTAGRASWLGGAQTANGNNFALLGCVQSTQKKITNTCAAPATFTFTLKAGSNFSLQNLHIGLRGQAWDANNGAFRGQSFKCLSSDPTCQIVQPPTSVPEPLTMTLLATGLVGIGLVQVRRRRRAQ
jgi:PEP-CTERM motif